MEITKNTHGIFSGAIAKVKENMRKVFYNWFLLNQEIFQAKNILTVGTNYDEEKGLDPGMVINQESPNAIGTILVWESAQIDFQVIDLITGNDSLHEHHEIDKNFSDFGLLVKNYIDKMQ